MTDRDAVIEIRSLVKGDLTEAVELGQIEKWNQNEDDWKRVLSLCPAGCFGAFAGGTLIGTGTAISYGQDAAWLGLMLVEQNYRRRGIARRLMLALLDYCSRSEIKTVKLDATPTGKHLYESLGFIAEAIVERWEAVAKIDNRKSKTPSYASSIPVHELYEFDRNAFGADRSTLLDGLIVDACCEPLFDWDRSFVPQMRGYALARCGATATYAGPIAAADEDVALSLLDRLLYQQQGKKMYLDRLVSSESYKHSLADRGWTIQRNLTRMYRGRRSEVGTSKSIFAIAGPELG